MHRRAGPVNAIFLLHRPLADGSAQAVEKEQTGFDRQSYTILCECGDAIVGISHGDV